METRSLTHPVIRSLALHVFMLLVLVFFVERTRGLIQRSEPIKFEIVEMTDDEKKALQKLSKSKQIVQKSEGREAQKAKEDSYLSDRTRVVDQELSARQAGDVDAVPTVQRASPQKTTDKPKEKSSARSAVREKIKLSDLGVRPSPDTPVKSFEEDRQWAPSVTGERVLGGQYIKGLKEGEVSALNTKEFVFFSYFDRIRRQLDATWQPLIRAQIAKIYKNGRRLASDVDLTTRTIVTLNESGAVVRVRVLEQSGTFDLDEAAIESLNRAGPYPNPPRGLVEAGGEVNIRWDFIIKT